MLFRDLPPYSGQRYDLADFCSNEQMTQFTGERADAAGNAFFLRDLTEVEGRTYDVKYPDLKARLLFPVFTGIDPGAEGYVWRQFDKVSAAKVIDDYAADLPTSEIAGLEFQSRCLSIGTSFNYSIQDIRRSRMAGIPLEARKALVAREAMERAFEQIAFFGIAQVPGTGAAQALKYAPATPNSNDPLAVYGITNFPAVSSLSLVQTTTNDWTNPATSVDSIVADFNKMFLQVMDQSIGVHTPNTAVLPRTIWSRLAQKPQSTTFLYNSVLELLMKLNPWLKQIEWSTMLETAGLKQDGSTPGPRILCYEKSEENVSLVVPQEFEMLPPQMVNMAFKIPCHMRVGGIRVSYPKAFTFLDGAAG